MSDSEKLKRLTELVNSWKSGGISDSAAMIVIADLVAPVPVTAADVWWGQDRLQAIHNQQDYDQWRRW